MGIEELVQQAKYEEGYEEGYTEGYTEGIMEGRKLIKNITRLLKKGKSPENISLELNESIELVERVKAMLR